MDTGTSWGEPISDAAGTSSWGNASLGQQASTKPGECFLRHLWLRVSEDGEVPLEKLGILEGFYLAGNIRLTSVLRAAIATEMLMCWSFFTTRA